MHSRDFGYRVQGTTFISLHVAPLMQRYWITHTYTHTHSHNDAALAKLHNGWFANWESINVSEAELICLELNLERFLVHLTQQRAEFLLKWCNVARERLQRSASSWKTSMPSAKISSENSKGGKKENGPNDWHKVLCLTEQQITSGMTISGYCRQEEKRCTDNAQCQFVCH